VTEAGFESVRLADLERADGWAPIRLRLGVRGFGINAWSAHEAAAPVIPDHDELPTRHEELYLVIAGHARFTVGGETVDAPTGTVVFVRDPALVRGAVAVDPETTVLAVGGPAGEAFAPRSWEVDRDVFPLMEQGRYAEARGALMGALDRYQDRTLLLFNLACAEARLGEHDAAFEHLGAAIAERPALIDHAREDDDLRSLHEDPRFGALGSAP